MHYLSKSFVPSALAASILSLLAPVSTAQANDDIPKYQDKVYAAQDLASLKDTIVRDPDFYVPLAYLSHYLGYGWCGGTASQNVGEDFSITRNGDEQYTLQANYNSSDPYTDGYWADKRLKMSLSGLKFYTNPGSLKLGDPQVYDREPLKTITAVVYNRGNTEDTAVATLQYDETKSWSKQEDYSFSESISIKNTYKFDLKIFGGSTEITAGFTANQGWSESNGNSETVTQSAQYRALMPANSKRIITLTVFKQKADIPYESEMVLGYNVALENFLRWGGNARNDHPTDRPWENFTFGGRNNLNGAEDILDQYAHRGIQNYGQWDWNWMLNQYGADSVKWAVGNISKRRFIAPLTGKFTTVDGSQFNIDASAPISLDSSEMQMAQQSARTKRSLGGNLEMEIVRVDDYSYDDTVTNLTFTLDDGLKSM
ncbi:aerolysin family beta-barrel pore-forming toxin [Hahella sp. HN01]|uniref:aerolysin family beta-barrel pore-forming toxin n=1 Tax=Hahella sp. HN01 TaxID=2847262 RepID=UPI001C1F0B04|nr:aerolysin family beta-barrel pore-forming toxin [Hahella sp. HN01]MBU6951341.1 aerolysin family beta-barrel pore-forming toxin [Hahella sp. HN01]